MPRRFSSYGPVDRRKHFVVERRELIERCVSNLVGDEEGGHYFTIWAPRQTGKTSLIREAIEIINKGYRDKFDAIHITVESLIEADKLVSLQRIISKICEKLHREDFKINQETEFVNFFKGDKPLILVIDEVDALRSEVLSLLVHFFREMYHERQLYNLHGLALVGVRAVAGVESTRGSPFNVQRSLHVENFSFDEVKDLFNQYMDEYGQKVTDEVIRLVYEKTDGHPGLVCWFGELLTEKYNPGKDKVIDKKVFEDVYVNALYLEPNNTVINIISKAKEYKQEVMSIYNRSDVRFTFDKEWCNYLYMHGVIKPYRVGRDMYCKISNEFIQTRLFSAFTDDVLKLAAYDALDPADELEDVFLEGRLNCRALIERYRSYLKKLQERGINPFSHGIRRSDGRLYEAHGHFHLYSWLCEALKGRCTVIPEFPTGNGKVDILVKCGEDVMGLIEVKVYVNRWLFERSLEQSYEYAKKLGMEEITIALFVSKEDPEFLKKLQRTEEYKGLTIHIEPIMWVY